MISWVHEMYMESRPSLRKRVSLKSMDIRLGNDAEAAPIWKISYAIAWLILSDRGG